MQNTYSANHFGASGIAISSISEVIGEAGKGVSTVSLRVASSGLTAGESIIAQISPGGYIDFSAEL